MSERTPIAKRVFVRIIAPAAPTDSRSATEKGEPQFRPLQPRTFVRPRSSGSVKPAERETSAPFAGSLAPANRAKVSAKTVVSVPSQIPEATPEMLAPADIFTTTRPEPVTPPALTTVTQPVELAPFEQVEPIATIAVVDAPEDLILWEQPPVSGGGIHERRLLPRWVDDVSAIPTDAEYAELGNYLVFLVDGFSNFCNSPSVTQSGQWQGRMRMPAAVLPDTMLQLDVSPLHARLRFETDHAISRELLARNINELQSQIKVALDDSREVEVSVW